MPAAIPIPGSGHKARFRTRSPCGESEELSWSETERLLADAGIPAPSHILRPAGASLPLLENMKQFMLRWGFIGIDFDVRCWAGESRTGRPEPGYRSTRALEAGAPVTSP